MSIDANRIYYLENLILLQHLSWKIEGKVFRVDNTLDETKPLRNEFFAVVCDEDTSNVEFDVILLLLRLKEIEGSSLRHKEYSAEFQLSLNRKVFDSKVVLPVVWQRLVEAAVLFFSDIWRIASPQRLGLVQLFRLFGNLLDFLGLFLFVCFFLIDFLNLRLLVVILSFNLFLFILNLLLNLFCDYKLNRVWNEFRMLLDDILDLMPVS